MDQLPVCVASALCGGFTAEKTVKRRIPDLVCDCRMLRTFIWQPVCHSVPACGSFLCPSLLDFRAYVGRMAWGMELHFNDGFGKALVQAAFQAEIYLNLTAVPYAITSAAPCITAEEA